MIEATPATALHRSGHATAAYRTLLGAFTYDSRLVNSRSDRTRCDLWVNFLKNVIVFFPMRLLKGFKARHLSC